MTDNSKSKPHRKCGMTNCKGYGNYRNTNGNKYCKKHQEIILAEQRMDLSK